MSGAELALAAEVVGPEVLAAGGMAAGEGLGMLSAAEAASLIAPEALGLGAAAGGSLLGGLELGGGMGIGGAEMMTPGIGEFIGGAGAGIGSTLGEQMLAESMMGSLIPSVTNIGKIVPFAPGAVTSAPGVASGFGPSAAATTASKPFLTGRQAMLLGQMASQIGDGEQRPLGAPSMEAIPPQARAGMATQEQITKAWLLKNDPATYYRMYGQPQMAGGVPGGAGYGY